MIKLLTINNFRCFSNFQLSNLRRINLLVGKNNSGKSSILEAVKLLYSQGNFIDFAEIAIARKEYDHQVRKDSMVEFSNFFFDREPEEGSFFEIIGKNSDPLEEIRLKATVTFCHQENIGQMIYEIKPEAVINNKQQKQTPFNLYGQSIKGIKDYPLKSIDSKNSTRLLPPQSLLTSDMIDLFEKIELTDNEHLIYKALQSIDSSIERVAPVDRKGNSSFRVKLKNHQRPVPIGSMGDGIYRILGLSLALVNVKNGILLVDEIDTGLHYTAMDDMWKMIW